MLIFMSDKDFETREDGQILLQNNNNFNSYIKQSTDQSNTSDKVISADDFQNKSVLGVELPKDKEMPKFETIQQLNWAW